MGEEDLAGFGRDFVHVGDDPAESTVVVDPLLVEDCFFWGKPHGHGLGCDFAGPLPVGAVAFGRVGLAPTVRVPTRRLALQNTALADEPDVGELGLQLLVLLLILLKGCGHLALQVVVDHPPLNAGQYVY